MGYGPQWRTESECMKQRFTPNDVGSVVATLQPAPSTAEELVMYSNASGDTNPLHLKLEFAKKAGFDNLVVHGMLGMAHMGRLLTSHFPAAAIASFLVRFSAVILVGEQVNYQATLEECGNEFYRLALVATTTTGGVVMKGEATIRITEPTFPT